MDLDSILDKLVDFATVYGIKIIGVASKSKSILLKASDIKLIIPKVKESDVTGMVPTSSTTITLLLGDCLATTVMAQRNFSKEKFKIFHPGGNIGSSLLLAKDIMVKGNKMPTINYKKNFKDALKIMNQKNLGILVILKNKYIKGLVTDGDLRREIKNYSKEKKLNRFMTNNPLIVNEDMPASKALGIMNEKKITSLLVVSERDYKKSNKTLKGIIHIHFLLQNGIK